MIDAPTVRGAFRRSAITLIASGAGYSVLAAVLALSLYWSFLPPWPSLGRALQGFASLSLIFALMLVLFRVLPAYRALRSMPSNLVDLDADLSSRRFAQRVFSNEYVAKLKQHLSRPY